MGPCLGPFHHQFKFVAEHNWLDWPSCRCRPLTSCIVRYKDINEVLEGRYGEHQLPTENRSQLKARTQLTGNSLQQFIVTTEQLAHFASPVIHPERAHVFSDRIRDQEVTFPFLTSVERMLDKALIKLL
jgi:hypothetical protein